jgi:hypothetical protein
MTATVRFGMHASARFVPRFGSVVRHLLNIFFAKSGSSPLMRQAKDEHLRTDGLQIDQLYVVLQRIFMLIPSYSFGM